MNNKWMKLLMKFIIAVFLIFLIAFLGYILRIDRFGGALISWADCVKINNNIYCSMVDRESIDVVFIDKRIGKVKFNVVRKVRNQNYIFRNGDATYLPVGTEIYSLKNDNNAIAVKVGNNYFIYRTRSK